ncbi:DUF6624 domain-containing protein [Streptomyces sp. NPDC054765]
MQRIIDEHGWPGQSLVGEEAANAAWLIAQHAELDFQLHALELIRDAVERGAATAIQLAYLTDRCLVRQQRPQLYGTQYRDSGDGRGMQLWEVAAPTPTLAAPHSPTVRTCTTCDGEKRIKTMQRGKVVVIRCRDGKGRGHQTS